MIFEQGPSFIKCEILEYQESLYGKLVLLDLATNSLIMLTVFPNWQGEVPKKGDVGYIEFEFCEAGITKYFDKHANNNNTYQNTYLVFKQFVKETVTSNKDVII